MEMEYHYIFGGPNGSFMLSRTWDEKDWTASDDRVRGGKSISRIITVVANTAPDTETETTVAKFSGDLDITALGGAGFASQRTTIFEGAGEALDLRGYDALVLRIVRGTTPGGDGESESESGKPVKKYTVTLKDTILPKRPDGREQSTVSWEADFVLGEEGKTATAITLPFEDFRPTYRGKPVEDGSVRLDWGGIKSVSIMVRSFFGDQYGPFSLVVSSIAARKTAQDSGGWDCCVI